jgi:hypothetical protein
VDYFEIIPNCMYKCFMLPFPFFCIGCCMSQTTKMEFDNIGRVVTLKTYCGYCCCCQTERRIPYNGLKAIDRRIVPGVRINNQGAFKVWLVWVDGELPLTADLMMR